MLTGELWEGLSPEELEQAERFCPERHLPEGATIFAPGDPSDALYVLKSGIVSLSHVSEDGQESILRVLIPGNVFGELFLTTPSRPFLASTLTACVVTPCCHKLSPAHPQPASKRRSRERMRIRRHLRRGDYALAPFGWEGSGASGGRPFRRQSQARQAPGRAIRRARTA